MKLYDKNGWLNIPEILATETPFIFIVGARGIGKTYGTVNYRIESGNNRPFLFMRRTVEQIRSQRKEDMSDLKKPLNVHGFGYKDVPMGAAHAEFLTELKDQDNTPISGVPFCYTMALSTNSSARGFDMSQVDFIFYDEFIAQPEERPIKDEAAAFFNFYETVNRNRELEGQEPVKVLFAANSFNLANPLFMALGIVDKVDKMSKHGQEIWINKQRGFTVILPLHSPISKRKSETALYKLTAGSDYENMALKNQFQDVQERTIQSLNLAEYKPVCVIGEICIYTHKSKDLYYVSFHRSGGLKDDFTMSNNDVARFKRKYQYLWIAHLREKIYFENYTCQVLFDSIYKK